MAGGRLGETRWLYSGPGAQLRGRKRLLRSILNHGFLLGSALGSVEGVAA
jgi:hypothetical protein